MKTLRPVNQKSVYQSFALIYDKLMNDEIDISKAEQANNALNGMNRTYALELKRSELEYQLKGNMVKTEIRIIETKGFDQIAVDDDKDAAGGSENNGDGV
jgi:hypothetical protein